MSLYRVRTALLLHWEHALYVGRKENNAQFFLM